ncbi:IPT/TIG domain-containing protein [Pedobacter nyackensis]|uniref:IPT/TIG domain-containing protein n=2 Tax=Pedobacter nyackensis TaxID=475255 RepID=A0A1W2F2M9_9SPHI|nr:IPT/TIG domain-containing protein [Pedobacter nyackensis]
MLKIFNMKRYKAMKATFYGVVLLLQLGLVSCKEQFFQQTDDSYMHNSNAPFVISKFSPMEGSEATEVMIYGDNYSSNLADVSVKINGKPVTVLGANGKRMIVKIPAGLGTGNIEITIAGKTVTSKEPFVYTLKRTVSTLAGAGVAGFADGSADLAKFDFRSNAGMDIDSKGNLYVADIFNNCIRKITPAGVVSTFIGKPGVEGYVNGNKDVALFNHPMDVAVDKDDNLYVADAWNWAVRKVTPDGVVSSIRGQAFAFPQGLAINKNTGVIYISSALAANYHGGKIYEFSASGVLNERGVDVPIFSGGMAVDSKGNLIIADNVSSVIYSVNTTTWARTAIAGTAGEAGLVDGVGAVARFDHPWGIAVDSRDNIYVAGCGHRFEGPTISASASNIRMIEAGTNKVSTIAGSDVQGYTNGLGGVARFAVPSGIAIGADGAIYVLDKGNHRIRKIVSQ